MFLRLGVVVLKKESESSQSSWSGERVSKSPQETHNLQGGRREGRLKRLGRKELVVVAPGAKRPARDCGRPRRRAWGHRRRRRPRRHSLSLSLTLSVSYLRRDDGVLDGSAAPASFSRTSWSSSKPLWRGFVFFPDISEESSETFAISQKD